ncbi:MAG: 3-dehydroquinate synthase family protein, partial [Vicinamibacterales bacterium]
GVASTRIAVAAKPVQFGCECGVFVGLYSTGRDIGAAAQEFKMLSYPARMTATRIHVTSSRGAYPVIVGPRVLETIGHELDAHQLGPRRILVSSPRVWKWHGRRFKGFADSKPVLVADGERSKTLRTVAHVHDALVRAKADRAVVIVAVGGGVIGDLVGFAAASYLRGVRIVHIPTTVVAQVDSAIGGKTGVNHRLAKNLIGAFHSPSLVAADPVVLATLAPREFRSGLYEVIKYGVIADPSLIERMRATLPAILARDADTLTPLIQTSCRIKAEIVSADERESGLRRVLNFGHTVGHALEAATGYRRFRHGEAVAYGMLAALSIGVARSLTAKDAYDAVSS